MKWQSLGKAVEQLATIPQLACENAKRRPLGRRLKRNGGADGNRTHDPLLAKQVL